MLLSDRDILQRMEAGDLNVEPLDSPHLQIQPSSIDLTLGHEFYELKADGPTTIDPMIDDTFDYASLIRCESGETYTINPGQLVLGTTVETIRLPSDIAGVLIGRSSLGRLGIVPYTGAGFVDPGFEGKLTLMFTNHGPFNVVLHPGEMRIVQCYLASLSSPARDPYGVREGSKYQNQSGPSQSRLKEDWGGGK